MPDLTFLSWPFFDDAHRALARELDVWAAREIAPLAVAAHGDRAAVDATTRELVKRLGAGGWLGLTVPRAFGGCRDTMDVRALCLARETLARQFGLADFAFAMQGLGSAPITLFGTEAQRQRYLPFVARGDRIAAFAISEREAGSDVAAMRTTARREGDGWIIDGEKTWISNAGIADHYVVFTRLTGADGYGAFVIDAGTPGLSVTERLDVVAPHPLGTIAFTSCRVGRDAMIGEPGKGLRVALGTLDVFRSTVGAAALGFSRRALDEALAWCTERRIGSERLADLQLAQAKLAEMAVAVDASALLVYRAAWTRDLGAARVTREAAMAKLFATEQAQRVIDDAVQLLGGRGVLAGSAVESLYREIRALRIYEGTSEIQRLIIAQQLVGKPPGRAPEGREPKAPQATRGGTQ